MAEAYIVSAARTAGGRRGGKLKDWHPADLAGKVLDAVVERAGIDGAAVEDVILGCVMQVGEQSAHIGRSAVMASSLPDSVPAVSIDRQCGSSQQAIQFAAQAVMSGTQDIVLAAGVESMTRVPMGLASSAPAQLGIGIGPWSQKIKDRYGVQGFSQFTGAAMIAQKYGFSRDQLDAFSLESHRRAAAATQAGAFDAEIVPIEIVDEEGNTVLHLHDEGIRYDATPESMASVKLLQEGGVLTAASASQICDGASGVLIVSERALKDHNLKPRARIHHMSVRADNPVWMLTGPIPATRYAMQKSGMKLDDIDLFECNEAFASVPMAWMKELGIPREKVNVAGGAIALGHPIGSTGARLMTTLLNALERTGGRYGLQTMCEGGGLANATIIERLG